MGDKERKDNDIAIEMAQNPLIQVEGEAASQMIQAYKGVRYDSKGTDLNHKGRNLKAIKGYKLNPRYVQKNIKQRLRVNAETANENMKSLVEHKENWETYEMQEKEMVFAAFKTVQVLKKIVEVPLLTQDGVLTSEAKNIEQFISEMN